MAKKHGHRKNGNKTPTYYSWSKMRERCNNPNHVHHANYGGRGVSVCERWSQFENFLEDMGQRPANKTLDRINPFGNYEPGNCRWASGKIQAYNKRRNAA